MKILEGLPTLQSIVLVDYKMETLPGYLQNVNPRILDVDSDISLLASMATGKSGPEWDKFSHIRQVKAYPDDKQNNVKKKMVCGVHKRSIQLQDKHQPLYNCQR